MLRNCASLPFRAGVLVTKELSSFVSNNPARKGNDAQFRSIWGTLQLEG